MFEDLFLQFLNYCLGLRLFLLTIIVSPTFFVLDDPDSFEEFLVRLQSYFFSYGYSQI